MGMKLKPLVWSEERKPNTEYGYNHCITETPVGRFVLTWKGWKSEPWQNMGIGFDVTPWGETWYEGWDTVDEAKEAAYQRLSDEINSMISSEMNTVILPTPNQASTPQPAPIPGNVDVYPLVISDILARVEAGKLKYGTTLQTNNGRAALWDLYQELIDACMYIRQAIAEQENET